MLPVGLEHPLSVVVSTRLVVNRNRPEDREAGCGEEARGHGFRAQPVGPESGAFADEPFQVVASNTALLDRLEKDPATPLPPFESWAWDPATLTARSDRNLLNRDLALRPLGIARISSPALRLDPDRADRSDYCHSRTAVLRNPASKPANTVTRRRTRFCPRRRRVRGRNHARGSQGRRNPEWARRPRRGGTPVAWSIVEGDGQLLDTENSVTANGRAIVRYRAGIREGRDYDPRYHRAFRPRREDLGRRGDAGATAGYRHGHVATNRGNRRV